MPARRATPRAPKRTRNPDHIAQRATDAEIRRLVAGEASTARGHEGLAMMHRRLAYQTATKGWLGLSEHHDRMADAHAHLARSLAALPRRR